MNQQATLNSQSLNLQATSPDLYANTFYATVVKLNSLSDGYLPATQGRLAHGAFLDLIRRVDPELSEALHKKNQRRPFTIAPLQGAGRIQNRQVRIRDGEEMWLRFTLLHDQLFATFTRYLLSAPGQNHQNLPALRLGNIDFVIVEMLTTPGSHLWAGYTTVAELCNKWDNVPINKANRKIELEFTSGTVFSRNSDKNGMGKFLEFLPVPEMVFGSLAAMWNEHTCLELNKQAVREYVQETVVVSAYKMETKRFYYWGHPQIGAVGRVTFQLKDKRNHQLIHTLNLLADFAFYSGIGAKTTMGMGQVRRINAVSSCGLP